MIALNLLPPSQKELLRLAIALKLALQLFVTALFVVLVFELMLLNALVFLKISVTGAEEDPQGEQVELKKEEVAAFEKRAREGKALLGAVASYGGSNESAVAQLSEIARLIPEEAYLTSLSFDFGSRLVSLSGFSPTRDVVLAFKEQLDADSRVQDLYFPYTNVIPEQEITFHTRFTWGAAP